MPAEKLFNFVRAIPRGIGRTNYRADAGAGDVVDRYVKFFKNAEDSQMGEAPGAATAQGEADLGSMERELVPAAAPRNDCGSHAAKKECRDPLEPACLGFHPKPRVPV